MNLLDYFRTKRPSSASVATERLQILIAHEHASPDQPSYLAEMQQELLAVVRKYVQVDDDAIKINFEQDENQEVFELEIQLPDKN